MASNSNRDEYTRRINRVIDFISRNLSESLSLESLADVAAFSPFHFHRVFKSMTNETLSEFVQRMRLEAAASALIHQPSRDITEVALGVGFSSSASFAHAFKKQFGASATEWRENGATELRRVRREQYSNLNQMVSKPNQASIGNLGQNEPKQGNGARLQPAEESMKVLVKNLPKFHVAYMRSLGPYGPTQIPALWTKLETWAKARDLMGPDQVSLGISHDDPNVTAPEKCRYDACLVVPDDFPADPKVNMADIPTGKYAVSEFVGTPHEIMEAWHQLFASWLPGSGYQADNRPTFELYKGDVYVDKKKGAFRCELCLPIKPL